MLTDMNEILMIAVGVSIPLITGLHADGCGGRPVVRCRGVSIPLITGLHADESIVDTVMHCGVVSIPLITGLHADSSPPEIPTVSIS